MGHYMDVKFEAKLNDLGAQLFTKLEELGEWRATAEFFMEYKFVEQFVDNGPARYITNAAHSTLVEGMRGSVIDLKAGTWTACFIFKDGTVREGALLAFLPYIVREPLKVTLSHELWGSDHVIDIEPCPAPVPDWDRKYGD